MTASEIIVKLYELHKMRHEMSYNSAYHQQYVDMAVELNNQLRSLTNRNFVELLKSEIDEAFIEYTLLSS